MNDENKEKSLEIIIQEQHRDYDYLLHIYNRMRAAENVLLTAAFAVIAYLYYPVSGAEAKSLAERFFVPPEAYGQMIYFIAAAFFLYGVVKLTLNVFGKNPWMTAYEAHKTNYSNSTFKMLTYVKKRYDECHEFNKEAYYKRKNEFTFLFFCILISAIILIVIKTLK